MKRFLSALLMLCLLFCLLPVSSLAVDNTYDLDELGMSIAVPTDHIVFTRNIEDNDPNLNEYGLTKEDMASLMLEKNIYLNAWDENVNYEIIVTMIESPFEDFNQFSNTTLTALTSSLATEYESAGITYINSDIYQHSQAKFIKIYISQPNNDSTAYGLQYYTVYNGKAINVTMQSYSGKIDLNKESILKEIVDTVHFDADPQLKDLPVQTKAFTYTDEKSGMSFTVPENWIETPMNEEREFIDVKFTSNLEEGLCIIFASEDMFGDSFWQDTKMSVFEKIIFSRSDCDNSLLTKGDVAAMYGCAENDVSLVSYGNKEYFLLETEQTTTSYGITVTVPLTALVRCENGYLYMFQFGGAKDNPYFVEFEHLVISAEYPHVEDNLLFQRRMMGTGLLVVLLFFLAVCILINSRRNCKKSANCSFDNTTTPSYQNEEASDDMMVSINNSEFIPKDLEESTANTIMFCHKCGSKIGQGARFCHKCGTMIPTKEEE